MWFDVQVWWKEKDRLYLTRRSGAWGRRCGSKVEGKGSLLMRLLVMSCARVAAFGRAADAEKKEYQLYYLFPNHTYMYSKRQRTPIKDKDSSRSQEKLLFNPKILMRHSWIDTKLPHETAGNFIPLISKFNHTRLHGIATFHDSRASWIPNEATMEMSANDT
jgi:hypothetical protein